jgi:hypothetical protein
MSDGQVPILGIVSMEDGQCVVTTDTGKRYWVHGDRADALAGHASARVWVVGDIFDTDAKTRPKKSTPLTVTGYRVVEENPAR